MSMYAGVRVLESVCDAADRVRLQLSRLHVALRDWLDRLPVRVVANHWNSCVADIRPG
jgi:hypothetical protein